jgi:hypothetical protein
VSTHRSCHDAAMWSLSGVKRTSLDKRKLVASDPQRHYATVNCRIAKGLFDHWLVSASGTQAPFM